MEVLNTILHAKAAHKPLLALLIDPDKNVDIQALGLCTSYLPDLIFVGGSTATTTSSVIASLRQVCNVPIVLFPGNIAQFSREVDAVLFLSVLSGRNAEMLVGRQVAIARQVKESGVESIPMGYILIDGGRQSSVELASTTRPIAQDRIDLVIDTAIAAELLGKQLIYLEAGSGAKIPVSEQLIRAVRRHTHVPLIVGGGICDISTMKTAYLAGADIVVIGNHFEQYPEQLTQFIQSLR